MRFLYLILPIALSKVVLLDNTDVVELGVNEHLDLLVSSNPSTGYIWTLYPETSPKLKVESWAGGDVLQEKSDIPGAPGKQLFHVDCEDCRDGEMNILTMQLKRAWEDKPVAMKQLRIMTRANM
jgi:predicted secreted protein